MSSLQYSALLERGRGEADARAAAEIWAAATAARDGEQPAPGDARTARAVIGAVLAAQGTLLLALDQSRRALGFATLQPVPQQEACAELRYLAVRPELWGQGAGRALMRTLPMWLRELGFERAWLTVYADNARARSLYELAGWRATGETLRHDRTGKPMVRYELEM